MFVKQQNAGYESKSWYLTSWTKKSPELKNIYILLPAYTSFLYSSCDIHTISILRYLHITWLEQNNATCSKTHPITCTTLFFPSGLSAATWNCIIMLTLLTQIHFQLTAIAPNCSRKGKQMARAKMPTSLIHQCLWLDLDSIKGFVSEYICGLIRIYNVCAIKDERAWDLLFDIIFLDPVITHHLSQCQLMWLHRRSRCSPFREWWAAFRSYMGQMFDKTREQINSWMWDNPQAFMDQVDRSNSQTTWARRVQPTSKHFCLYGSDDLRALVEPPCCLQYKPGDFLAIGQLNWHEILDEDDGDE